MLPRQETFRYKYLRHPFDNAQHFSVLATAEHIADRLAKERFAELFRVGHTVTLEFYRA